jgi:FkbM family methyltransferase
MYNSTEEFIRILKKNNIKFKSFIEIGSRDGKDADLLSKSFNLDNSDVHIIEPNPVYLNKIKNSFPNYTSYEVGFSNINGYSEFYQLNSFDESLNGMSSLLFREYYNNVECNIRKIEIRTQTASDFIDENKIEDCIVKIDVEGFSYEVLQGFGDKLNEIRAIHVETEEYQIWDNQKTTYDIFNLLSGNFIRVFKKKVTDANHHEQYDEIWINNKYFNYSLDNYFDKIFYINLDKDVDKNQHMISELKKWDITNFERIPGFTLEGIPDYGFWRNFNIDSLSEKYILGSLGCRASHLHAINLSIERNYSKILILEDDIFFTENPNELLKKQDLNNWDMLYFGGLVEPHYRNQVVGGFAYGVNSSLFKEILIMGRTSGMEIDNFYAKIIQHMSYNHNSSGRYNIKLVEPFNTVKVNFDFESNIR